MAASPCFSIIFDKRSVIVRRPQRFSAEVRRFCEKLPEWNHVMAFVRHRNLMPDAHTGNGSDATGTSRMIQKIRKLDSEQNSRPDSSAHDRIVFFDGVCGFCNSSVNFLMSHDLRRRLKFAPLQGKTAALLLPAVMVENLDSLVFLSAGRMYVRSAAVVRILRTMGGGWILASWLLWLCPLPLRDLGYRLIAAVRYRLFGKKESCRLPTAEERGLILD